MQKIVVGKPATPSDAYNTGHMEASVLNNAIVKAYKDNSWKTGVMYWQFSSDHSSSILNEALSGLYQLLEQEHH